LLTSRGLYEIRSGRAIHRVAQGGRTRVQVGGALKASIEAEGVVQTGNGQKNTIVAAIRYAKFVEFPTIHNAAQPFLRPALHANRETLPRVLGEKIRSALRGR
jgi:HK97 gp10 family phage protein